MNLASARTFHQNTLRIWLQADFYRLSRGVVRGHNQVGGHAHRSKHAKHSYELMTHRKEPAKTVIKGLHWFQKQNPVISIFGVNPKSCPLVKGRPITQMPRQPTIREGTIILSTLAGTTLPL
jgi:hypothetical protein